MKDIKRSMRMKEIRNRGKKSYSRVTTRDERNNKDIITKYE
jgi:hypothetical protein